MQQFQRTFAKLGLTEAKLLQAAEDLEHEPLAHVDDGVRAGAAGPLYRQRREIASGNLLERRSRPELQCALVADHENSLALPEINSPNVWRADNNRA